MEENQPKIGKYGWTFGLILGAISIIFSVMLYSMDLHYERGLAIQLIGFALLAITIVIAIIQFKKDNGGYLALSHALKLGAAIALISGIIGIAYFLFQSNVLEPDYWDKAYEIGKFQAMEQNPNLTEEQIDQGIELQKSLVWLFYPIGLIFNVLMGLLFGLIPGLIMKKSQPEY